MERLLSELTSDERKLYDIGYDSGKEKGTMLRFAIGGAIGCIITLIVLASLIN